MPAESAPLALKDQFSRGLDAPICLTWELTYACNLACVHCLSSSGRRDPGELTPAEARGIVDELVALKVFYVNIGGGEPMLRPDFFDLVEYAVERKVGVKFSTNGTRLTCGAGPRAGRHRLPRRPDQHRRGDRCDATTPCAARALSRRPAPAMDNLAAAGFGPVQDQRRRHPPQRRRARRLRRHRGLLRRPAAPDPPAPLGPWRRHLGRAAPDVRHNNARLYHWLLERPDVLTGDSFFHLSALGEPLAGLNLCGAGRVVCLIDPIGDVYACPFVIHDEFQAGTVRDQGGFADGLARLGALRLAARAPERRAPAPRAARYDACQGGCMAAKFFTGLPLDGPDPECVHGHGETALATLEARPRSALGHSKVRRDGTPVPVPTPVRFRSPARA